jgi:hypothetical protein
MRSPFGCCIAAALALSDGHADAAEKQILDAISNGTVTLETEVALPGADASSPGAIQQLDVIRRITKEQEKLINEKAYPLMLAKWPFNSVAVCWENPTPQDVQERNWVKDAIAGTWQMHSGLQVTGWERCAPNNQGIRILIEDAGPHVKFLGKFVDGKKNGMLLNFTFQSWGESCRADEAKRKSCVESIAVHEFGHAIGFAHEQNRPDTTGECAERKQGPNGDTIYITPWDLTSVMNYCNSVYNNNGVLSEFDIVGVRYVYGLPKTNQGGFKAEKGN